MSTWVVGDIHGCAEELAELLARLALGPEDRFISVGDLFHRGPDPVGVMGLLREQRACFVLGNHERAVLARFELAPGRADASDRPGRRDAFPPLDEDDLAGDGGMPCDVPAARRAEILTFLQQHAGYYLEHDDVEGAGPTADGRAWCVVHAGLVPGEPPAHCRPFDLIRMRQLDGRGGPFWYEVYTGPNLVLFGHTPSRRPRARHHEGRLVALGLDTGCVYGGRLSAYSPELDELVQVDARRTYFEA